jgi:RNA polymerase sigma-70 factor (ECF subfamily)
MPTLSTEDEDREAMARLASGHSVSLDELMERHGERLFHYLIRLINNESEAADLAQETFVRVYQNSGKYDPRQTFSTWLYAIATNLTKDRWRWHARRPEVSLDQEHGERGSLGASIPESRANPGEELIAEERSEMVRDAIAALPEELRVPLVLAEYEQKSHEQIGAVLGCSAKAVEMRIYRARKELRKTLEELLEH